MFKITILCCLVLFLAYLNGSSFARVAPSYIQPCPGVKPDCFKKAIQDTLPLFAKGIPELGIEPIDPLRQDYVKLELPGGFKMEFRNGTVTGLRNCIIDSATFRNNEGDVKMRCDLTIKGMYKASGNLLIVVINGNGDAKIKIKNAQLRSKIKLVDKVRDGIVYSHVKKIENSNNFGDKVTFSLTNLFDGNPELSETVLQFMNQNWKQVSEEFGKPVVDDLVERTNKIIKKFFDVVPKDELFVD